MKKIVNILTIVTLATATFPTINSITNTKLNQNINFQQKEVIDLGAKVFGLAFKDDDLYAGTWDNKIYKINISEQTKTEVINLGAKVDALIYKDNNLYAGMWNNKIYEVNL